MQGPGHTIQFMRYGYREYVRQVLESSGRNLGDEEAQGLSDFRRFLSPLLQFLGQLDIPTYHILSSAATGGGKTGA